MPHRAFLWIVGCVDPAPPSRSSVDTGLPEHLLRQSPAGRVSHPPTLDCHPGGFGPFSADSRLSDGGCEASERRKTAHLSMIPATRPRGIAFFSMIDGKCNQSPVGGGARIEATSSHSIASREVRDGKNWRGTTPCRKATCYGPVRSGKFSEARTKISASSAMVVAGSPSKNAIPRGLVASRIARDAIERQLVAAEPVGRCDAIAARNRGDFARRASMRTRNGGTIREMQRCGGP